MDTCAFKKAMQAKVVQDSEKARSKFFTKHKSEIDSALTLVQSVLRGHRARQELQEGMEALRRAAPTTTARSAPVVAAAAAAVAEAKGDRDFFGVQRSPTRSRRNVSGGGGGGGGGGSGGGAGSSSASSRTLPDSSNRSSRRLDGNAAMGSSVGSTTAPHLLEKSGRGGLPGSRTAPAPVPIAAKQPPRYIPAPKPAAATAALPVTSSVSGGTRYSDEESNSDRSPTPTQSKHGGGGRKTPISRPTSASSFASSFVSEDLSSASDSEDSDESDDDF